MVGDMTDEAPASARFIRALKAMETKAQIRVVGEMFAKEIARQPPAEIEKMRKLYSDAMTGAKE